MPNLDAQIRAWFMDNDRDDNESARNLAKTCDALSTVLDLCFTMDGQVTGEGAAEHPVAKLVRERIASKLGVSDA